MKQSFWRLLILFPVAIICAIAAAYIAHKLGYGEYDGTAALLDIIVFAVVIDTWLDYRQNQGS